jgi:hypothetical protein
MFCIYILRPFGIFSGHLVFFFSFWYILPRKNLATLERSFTPPNNLIKADGLTLSRSEHNLSLFKMRNVKLNKETVEAEKHSKVRERAHLKGQII